MYELLVGETSDRGKETKVLLDWTDPDLLRELLRRRFVFGSGLPETSSFEDVWRAITISHVGGEESSQFVIDRCLMRPRALLVLVGHCRSVAINLRHQRIEQEDFEKGLQAFSTDLLSETNFLAITAATLKQRPWSEHATALVYGLDYALVCFLLAAWTFRRRSLARE